MSLRFTALATLAMLLAYFWTSMLVAQGRRKFAVKAPAITGPDDFNRIYRAHVNTLEQLVLMLPALWLFAMTVGDSWAGLLGLVWVVGRIWYVTAYAAAADKRGPGFMISFAAFAVAIVGTLIQLMRSWL